MDKNQLKSLIAKLHHFERKVLPVLKDHTNLISIAHASGMQEVEVVRALQWLQNKGVLNTTTTIKTVVNLDSNGLKYKQEGLPEKVFLKALTSELQPLSKIAEKTKLSSEELSACI